MENVLKLLGAAIFVFLVVAFLKVIGYFDDRPEEHTTVTPSNQERNTTENSRQDRMLEEKPTKQDKGPSLSPALLPEIHIGPWTINPKSETQPSVDVASDFIGRWSGEVLQTGSVKDKYPVDIRITSGTISDQVGTFNYSTLKCGGDLILVSANRLQLSVEERLTSGLLNCIDRSIITLTRNATDGTLEYNARVADLSAKAVLKKTAP
jgi:hypothetical protein